MQYGDLHRIVVPSIENLQKSRRVIVTGSLSSDL